MPAAAHSLRECRGAIARPCRQLAYRGYPRMVTPMVAHMFKVGTGGRRGRWLHHREAAAGASRLRRTVCESVGERWRDRAGSLRTVGIP